jgi:Plavaka transposase
MTQPEIVHCADGYFQRVIYGLGPYIADYPEQALLACTGILGKTLVSAIEHTHGYDCIRCTAPS